MKNVKINHTFTLKDILLNIQKVGIDARTFEHSSNAMISRIDEYLEIITDG